MKNTMAKTLLIALALITSAAQANTAVSHKYLTALQEAKKARENALQEAKKAKQEDLQGTQRDKKDKTTPANQEAVPANHEPVGWDLWDHNAPKN